MGLLKTDQKHPTRILILRELAFGSSSVKELMEVIGCSYNNMLAWVKYLYKEKLIHIAGYEPGNNYTVLYGLGEKKDAPRPRCRTSAERTRKWKAKRKMTVVQRGTNDYLYTKKTEVRSQDINQL